MCLYIAAHFHRLGACPGSGWSSLGPILRCRCQSVDTGSVGSGGSSNLITNECDHKKWEQLDRNKHRIGVRLLQSLFSWSWQCSVFSLSGEESPLVTAGHSGPNQTAFSSNQWHFPINPIHTLPDISRSRISGGQVEVQRVIIWGVLWSLAQAWSLDIERVWVRLSSEVTCAVHGLEINRYWSE